MDLESCYILGKITRLHGVKGEVAIKFDVDDPYEYEELESVFLEKNQKLIPFFIDSIRIVKDNMAIIQFEDVDLKTAEGLINTSLYLPLENLPELEEGQFYYHDIIGYQVEDKTLGKLGVISNVFELPGHDLLEMNYKNQEVLIPLHDDIILSADQETKVVYVNLPAGLMDVYLSEEGEPDDED
ncbi:ribosome maturation factor RimM [Sporocytophaga myxococcoides]|uniref:Ribosome maturation factor RimM n=1 Tax=Sporocytophaga myxococcoides TaxID=153721 RepID=A0A098LEC2_9BACT|nr:ribosome maturation factor RimM [Sporocytophaga myxococcoides]GAL84767.1 ribosome maturation factor RimM [Sporocytophaga myxococcoides]